MSQFAKFKARIMDTHTSFDIMPNELQTFMAKYGFELHGVRGSHYNYKHPDLKWSITIPMHEPVKPVYIALLRDTIEELEGKNEKL